ncbi:Glycosyltransferase like family protein [Halpernia humi]|uniref:Glycosyltransferase like family protein n=1 Tax=Halpernia humi TaxID=493375 RepID=A0A1H5W539_9FLAO|nr:glycosyltransferase [Halpernia humi]SEF94605.1 Glycosyltransferase like family protein [Halpernia humi]
MLSIIISSYQKDFYENLVENINETIGEAFLYEILPIWNPKLMGICAAYNLGAKKSKFENLLFLHEDLIFKTKNWGEKLISHLTQKNTGIIGVAGSSYVPKAPFSWTVAEKYNVVNILQGNKEDANSILLNSTKSNRNKVFAVDGVFLAVKKEVFNQCKFDEDLLKGFHGYDLDFSLSVAKQFQNYVIDDILIEHFSKGNLDCEWLQANIKVRQKHNFKFQERADAETERQNFLGFLYKYFECKPVNFKNLIFTLGFYPFWSLKMKDHYLILKKYFNYFRYRADINKKQIITKLLK